MQIKIPRCDECGGTDFDEICLTPIEREYVSASEYFNRSRTESTPAIMIYRQYKAICKKCKTEYTYTT